MRWLAGRPTEIDVASAIVERPDCRPRSEVCERLGGLIQSAQDGYELGRHEFSFFSPPVIVYYYC